MAEGPGFFNVSARTREERNAESNKDAFEKNRLRARQGSAFEIPDNPLVPQPFSPSFADPMDRFYRDSAAAEKARKAQVADHKQYLYERTRDERAAREETRLTKLHGAEDTKLAHLQSLRDSGMGGKSNRASEHFDILNLQYHESHGGQVLKFHDDSVKYKAMLRTEHLYNRTRSVPHNIITGEVRDAPFAIPAPPAPPAGHSPRRGGH